MRKTRILQKGSKYHVIAKINRSEFLLQVSWIKEEFISILKEKKQKYSYHIHQFCIMDNHIHLIIEPLGESSLSRIMQSILCTFAIRFNSKYNLKGHIWYDRFKSIIIQNIFQFLSTFDYISNNPVKAGIIDNPELYPFGGIYDILYQKMKVVDTIDYYRQALFVVSMIVN